MRRLGLKAVVIFIGGLASLLQPVLAEPGWQILQTGSLSPMGPGTRITVTPTGMIASTASANIVLVTRGPSWNVVMYNRMLKTIYQNNLRTWIQEWKRREGPGQFEGATWKRVGTIDISGIRAYGFAMEKGPTNTSGKGRSLYGSTNVMAHPSSAQLWVAQDIVVPPEVSDLIAQLYGVPDCRRIPLKVTAAEAGKPAQALADTIAVKRMDVPESMFQSPSGYQQVQADMDVFVGRGQDLEKLLK